MPTEFQKLFEAGLPYQHGRWYCEIIMQWSGLDSYEFDLSIADSATWEVFETKIFIRRDVFNAVLSGSKNVHDAVNKLFLDWTNEKKLKAGGWLFSSRKAG